ncbi:MAG: endonuclease III [Candidatus Methanosuratus sp.]|nr:endonuclease III [Candidatus Methanosuratincola sp.]
MKGALEEGEGGTALAAVEERLRDPFAVLIATVLSHRTKDEKTSEATMRLFGKFRTAQELASADEGEVAELIRGVGFYRNKARAVIGIAREISKKYGGEVPRTLKELMDLPSVGRKTANCVLVYGLGMEAIPVDTHVHRIANRLWIVETKTPEDTENRLMEIFPKSAWSEVNETFVMFGKKICRPVGPRCGSCPLMGSCRHYRSISKQAEAKKEKQTGRIEQKVMGMDGEEC